MTGHGSNIATNAPWRNMSRRVVTRKEYFYFQLQQGNGQSGARIALNDPHSLRKSCGPTRRHALAPVERPAR